MTDPDAQKRSRIRWVTLGEAIAIAALILSGLGLWHEWSKPNDKPVVVEKRSSIPLTLQGRVDDKGRVIEIAPAENTHALQSMTMAAVGKTIDLGSGGRLTAKDFEDLVGKYRPGAKGKQRATVRITTKYVEAGADKSATGSYTISYRWVDGGLFGGRHVQLEDFSR